MTKPINKVTEKEMEYLSDNYEKSYNFGEIFSDINI